MHILIFGDSITQGFDDYEVGGWPNRLFIDVSARQDPNNTDYISVFNLGVDGDTTRDVLARIEAEIEPRKNKQTIIIFDIGGNDSARDDETGENIVSFAEFSKNYRSLINIGKKYGPVVCLGLHESDDNVLPGDHSKYDAEIEHLAAESGSLYLSMKGLLSNDFATLTYDGDHPSPEGHRLIYERVKGVLKKEGLL